MRLCQEPGYLFPVHWNLHLSLALVSVSSMAPKVVILGGGFAGVSGGWTWERGQTLAP